MRVRLAKKILSRPERYSFGRIRNAMVCCGYRTPLGFMCRLIALWTKRLYKIEEETE